MKTYTVKCPACGRVNKNLYLDETDGWMECEKCHILSYIPVREEGVKGPACTMEVLLSEKCAVL